MTCKHRDEHGEGVELPTAVSLEHFDQCFTPEKRLEHWEQLRDQSDRAWRCLMADHEGLKEQVAHLTEMLPAPVVAEETVACCIDDCLERLPVSEARAASWSLWTGPDTALCPPHLAAFNVWRDEKEATR